VVLKIDFGLYFDVPMRLMDAFGIDAWTSFKRSGLCVVIVSS